jgi:cyclopropane fatty-acyl-phospholipid synthase-like methyltransferase
MRSLRSIPHRLYEKLMDRVIGIDSSGYFRPAELEGSECLEYNPVPYRGAKRLLSSIEVSRNDVFVEYGCGKGGILALAAAQPYRKIIGVEISPPLCRDAELNVKRSRLKRRCSAIEILPANATAFEVPDDATVLFFGNPFKGEIMRTVVAISTHRTCEPAQDQIFGL